MKVVTCDICGKNLDSGAMPKCIERKSALLDDRPGAKSPIYPFTFTIQVACYQFNTTNFDVCETCVLKAIARTVNA